jgi:EAL domain-containing protein (putative c-di-GMP-specific phosphodiesterase class I)
LSYLKRLPINELKIDQSFIKDIPHDDEDVAITKAIIALAQSMKLHVIAEGVETEQQKEFLLANECMNMQGYLYSKPVSSEEIYEIMKNN